jgi:alpha 1,2-mannosyltransferase
MPTLSLFQQYNRCHFWSNFEIGSLDFLRSDAYTKYFEHLDKSGGFSYERWGGASFLSFSCREELD